LIKDLAKADVSKENILCGAQRLSYTGTQDEYLTFTIARPAHPSPNRDVSVTIGLQIDAHLRKKIKFLDDSAIPNDAVGVTCERCAIQNCKERVSPPLRLEERARRQQIQKALAEISAAV
jgi:predicted transcriptional regulator